jgi:predicted DNA binding CopG/RHH family protein
MQNNKPQSSAEDWETGRLGQSAEFAVAVSEEECSQIDDSMNLKPISIRLEPDLLNALKLIANVQGLGYQPLIRRVLKRFANAELKIIADQFPAMPEPETRKAKAA